MIQTSIDYSCPRHPGKQSEQGPLRRHGTSSTNSSDCPVTASGGSTTQKGPIQNKDFLFNTFDIRVLHVPGFVIKQLVPYVSNWFEHCKFCKFYPIVQKASQFVENYSWHESNSARNISLEILGNLARKMWRQPYAGHVTPDYDCNRNFTLLRQPFVIHQNNGWSQASLSNVL
jgi:hypothetical protein